MSDEPNKDIEYPEWLAKYNLTGKQRNFVIEYLKDFRPYHAAVEAGYSEATAYQIASENLNKPNIKKAINEGSKYVIEDKFDHIKAKTLHEIEKLSFIDITEFYNDNGDIDFEKLKKESKGVISGIKKTKRTDKDGGETETIEIKTYSKEKTLDLLARYTQLANETIKHEHAGGLEISFVNSASEKPDETSEDE